MSKPSGGTAEDSQPGVDDRRVDRKMAAGAAWVVGTRTVVRLLGLVSTVILARLLTPADFGLIALATMLSAGLEVVSQFSFNVWLIRHPGPEREHYDTGWTLQLIRGVLLALVIGAAGQPMAAFFDEPRLQELLLVLGVAVLVQGLVNIGIVDFQKQLEFDKDFLMFTIPKVCAFLVTISCGIVFRSYWALMAGIVTAHLATLALSYHLHRFRPRWSLEHWREAFGFSKWLLAGNWLGFAYLRVDTFILGKLLGMQSVGVYAIAKEIADLSTSELVAPIRRVMLPGYAQLREDPELLRRSFVEGFAVILFLGLPCAVGIGLVAEPLVRLMLGTQWLEAIPLVKVLAWYAVASVGIANQGPLLIALGHVRTSTAIVAIGVALLVPSFLWGAANHGTIGATVAASVVNWVMLVVSLSITLRLLRVTAWSLIRMVWRFVLSTMCMYVGVTSVLAALGPLPALLGLLAGVLAGVAGYVASTLAIWLAAGRPDGPERATLVVLGHAAAKVRRLASGTVSG